MQDNETIVPNETPAEVEATASAEPTAVAKAPAAVKATAASVAAAPAADEAIARGRRKERIGKVTSDKMQKTVVVENVRQVAHTKYKKYFKKTTKFVAHSENNDAKMGDTVRIMETRPLSKTKRWRVVEVIERAK
jgi:small subunit ribosomal protein S17